MNEQETNVVDQDSTIASADPAPIQPPPPPAPSPEVASTSGGGCGRYFAFGAGLALILVLGLLASQILPGLLIPSPPPSPTPTPRPPVVTILSLRPLAKLATVEYPVVVDIPSEHIPDDIRKHVGVREKMLMLVYGEVKAGFDLSKLTDEDIWIDGTRVQLYLPEPEILSTSIDFEQTRIVDYERSIFLSNDPDLQAETLEKGIQAIEQAVLESGILETATLFGQMYFENHLRSLGFTEVKVLTKGEIIIDDSEGSAN